MEVIGFKKRPLKEVQGFSISLVMEVQGYVQSLLMANGGPCVLRENVNIIRIRI